MIKKISMVFFLTMGFITGLNSCKKEVAQLPTVEFTASSLSVDVGESVTFYAVGSADGFAIYTGDAGHQFAYSRYVLTKNQDIVKEITYLTQANFDTLSASGLVVSDSILNLIRGMINIKYDGRSHPEEIIKEFYNYDIVGATLLYPIVDHFTIEKFTGVPADGYATGVALDPEIENRIYKYAYAQPGIYEVSLLASNVGRKKYDKDGYNGNYITNENEYDKKTVIKTITITVM